MTYSYANTQEELADESENPVLKINKSKIKVMIENGASIYVNTT